MRTINRIFFKDAGDAATENTQHNGPVINDGPIFEASVEQTSVPTLCESEAVTNQITVAPRGRLGPDCSPATFATQPYFWGAAFAAVGLSFRQKRIVGSRSPKRVRIPSSFTCRKWR